MIVGKKKIQRNKKMTQNQNEKESADLLKEDLKTADCEYIKLIKQLTKLEEENEILKQRLQNVKEGVEGCCYACEPVGTLNQKLENASKKLYGVVLHLEAITKNNVLAVVGDGLYSEAVDAIKAYEELYGN